MPVSLRESQLNNEYVVVFYTLYNGFSFARFYEMKEKG